MKAYERHSPESNHASHEYATTLEDVKFVMHLSFALFVNGENLNLYEHTEHTNCNHYGNRWLVYLVPEPVGTNIF